MNEQGTNQEDKTIPVLVSSSLLTKYSQNTTEYQSLKLNMCLTEKKKIKWGCIGHLKDYEGVLCASMAGSLYVLMAAGAKYLKDYNPLEINFYSNFYMAIFSLTMACLRINQFVINKTVCIHWTLATIILTISNSSRIVAFKKLPLGDASIIVFSTPIFAAFMARIILKERLSRLTVISLLLSVLGICLTFKLPRMMSDKNFTKRLATTSHLIGCGYALLAAICGAAHAVTMRKLKEVHPIINAFIMGLQGAFLSGCLTPAFGGFHLPTCSIAPWGLVGVCVAYFLNITSYSRALQLESTISVVTVFRTSDILLSFACQVLLFRESADVYSISGAVLALASGICMPLQVWMKALPEGSPWKVKFFMS